MRELRLFPTKSQIVRNVVHRLQFVAGGADLVGWVEESGDFEHPERLCANSLFRCSLATGEAERLRSPDFGDGITGPLADMALSPDGRLVVAEMHLDGSEGNMLLLYDQRQTGTEFAVINTDPIEFAGVFFTPAGASLIAVRSWTEFETIRDVMRFDLGQFTAPVKKYTRHPFTGVEVPVRNLKWKVIIARTGWERPTAAALSANGRFLAVADETGDFHIADLKAKRALASLPPEAKMRRDQPTVRVAFDPQAKWLVRLAGGKLFARTVAGGNGWQTKPDFGHVHDFAFHPSGRTLCAVCADGQARTLDPLTGTPLQAFKWGTKPLYSVAFSPDGLTCAAGAENGRVVIWDVDE